MARRSLFVVMAAAVLLTLCAGCAGSHPAAASNALAPATAPQQTTPNAPYMVPAPKRQADAPPTAVVADDAPPCDPNVLSVEEIAGNASGAYHSVKLAFRNRGSLPCRLSGYPTVALLGTEGEKLDSIAMEKISTAEVMAELAETHVAVAAAPVPKVTLMPHSVAAFEVVWTTGPECPSVSRLLVSAPGTERIFAVTQPMKVCAGRVQVTELQPDQGDV